MTFVSAHEIFTVKSARRRKICAGGRCDHTLHCSLTVLHEFCDPSDRRSILSQQKGKITQRTVSPTFSIGDFPHVIFDIPICKIIAAVHFF